MIELAAKEYWNELTLTESRMYCFSLSIDGKIGWRLPTQVEYIDRICSISCTSWDQSDIDDEFINSTDILMCILVRTKDD